MNFFTPGIALLKPMSGRFRFWVLPIPLLLALLIVLLGHLQGAAASPDGGAIVTVTLSGMLLWWYLQLCFFKITRGERDRTEGAMKGAANGDLTFTGGDGVKTLGNFGRHLESMIVHMSSMVANIRTAAVLLGDTGRSLVQDTRSLAERAAAQGEHLQQIGRASCRERVYDDV